MYNRAYSDGDCAPWQSTAEFSPHGGVSPNMKFHPHRQFRYPSPRGQAFLCSTPRLRHGSPSHNQNYESMSTSSSPNNHTFSSPFYQSQFAPNGNQKFWTPPSGKPLTRGSSHNRTLPPNYKQHHHTGYRSDSSNNIAAYYSASMLHDPWSDTPATSVSKSIDLTPHHAPAVGLHHSRNAGDI